MTVTIARPDATHRWVLKTTKKGKQKLKRVPVDTHVPVPAAPVKAKIKSRKERARKGRVTDKGYHRGRRPANKGKRYPATPLTRDQSIDHNKED